MNDTKIIKSANSGEFTANEPDITDHYQPIWLNVFEFAFASMLKKAFYSFRVKNKENFEQRDRSKGTILFASHCCWWDGLVAYILCRKVLNIKIRMMIEELYRFPLLSRIGAFSVEKDSPQSAVKALNYCAGFLKHPDSSLWIYPQGAVLPPDHRPVKFASGIAYLCSRLNGINLVPIAHRYNFIREDRPEIFIEIGTPIILNDKNIDRKEFTYMLEQVFTELIENQRIDISNGKFDNYEFVFKSRLCVAKLIENHFTKFVRTFNT